MLFPRFLLEYFQYFYDYKQIDVENNAVFDEIIHLWKIWPHNDSYHVPLL